jgi:hypothetical protein
MKRAADTRGRLAGCGKGKMSHRGAETQRNSNQKQSEMPNKRASYLIISVFSV